MEACLQAILFEVYRTYLIENLKVEYIVYMC